MLKRILVALVALPYVFAAILAFPPVVWTVTVCAISGIAAFELLRAAGGGKITKAMEWASILSAALIPAGVHLGYWTLSVTGCTLLVMVICFVCAIHDYDGEHNNIGFFHILLCLMAGVIIPNALAALIALMAQENGRFVLFLAVCLAFITDGGAYFVGVFLGKHKGILRVSPNKSLEGFIGGFVTGILFALLFGVIIANTRHLQANYISLAICGLAGALVTEIGDLSFSLIKREFQIKDFGHLLPGHGGMLDRFDSMIFCGPIVLCITECLPAFGGVL